MVHVSNSNARKLVIDRVGFKGSHTFAEWKNGLIYFVYSYGYHFPMYAYKAGQWYANRDKYSVSTSRHQSQLNPLVDNVIELSTAEMKALV